MSRGRTRTPASSVADAISSPAKDKYDIPAFLRRQSDDAPTPASPSAQTVGQPYILEALPDIPTKACTDLDALTSRMQRSLHSRSESPGLPDKAPRTLQDFLWALETRVLVGGHPYSLKTLADLTTWGVEPEVIADLEGLVRMGMAEVVVVASFLSAVCHSPLRDQLERRTRIKILAIAKTSAPDPALIVTLTDALARADAQAWHWRSLTLDAVAQP